MDLLSPSKNLGLNAGSRSWINSENIAATCKRDETFKNHKNVFWRQT